MRRLAALATTAVCSLALVAPPASAASTPQTISRGHVQPWGIAFLPDGSALFTERNSRRLWAVTPGRPARVIYTVSEAAQRGEGGLLGVAVGPDYPSDQRVYPYYNRHRQPDRLRDMRFGGTAAHHPHRHPRSDDPQRRSAALRSRRTALRRHR